MMVVFAQTHSFPYDNCQVTKKEWHCVHVVVVVLSVSVVWNLFHMLKCVGFCMIQSTVFMMTYDCNRTLHIYKSRTFCLEHRIYWNTFTISSFSLSFCLEMHTYTYIKAQSHTIIICNLLTKSFFVNTFYSLCVCVYESNQRQNKYTQWQHRDRGYATTEDQNYVMMIYVIFMTFGNEN